MRLCYVDGGKTIILQISFPMQGKDVACHY